MTMRAVLGVLLGAALGLAVGCGSSRRSEPELGPPPLDEPPERRGEVLFAKFCDQCHPGGAGGLGPGLNNKPAPAAAIRLQIRSGLGAMPAFSEREIPDADVDAIIAYMLTIRSHEKGG
ncbi:cytochrome C [Sorangium cellulosum]|uniref:Cytochrome C n=2 Tax=Sorangium cellulosum TaxID=56 RepID=A0A2L0FB20_SORCE|nr:cytochrome C [Sorangium cellulosum]